MTAAYRSTKELSSGAEMPLLPALYAGPHLPVAEMERR
jgi:hypothetical protein